MGKNRYIFESGHIVPSLGAWYGVITVCAGSFHSGEHFWCFSTSGITWGCAFGVSAFIDPIFILGHFLFSWCNCWKRSWLDFFIGLWLVSSIGFPMGMDPLYVPLEFIYWWIVALIGMNFNLVLFLVHLLEFSWYTPLTGSLGGTSGEVSFPNISARDINSFLCDFTSVPSGMAGYILCSAWNKYCTAWIVASVEEIFGMLISLGETLLCLRFVLLLFWGCMPYGIYIFPWMVQYTRRFLHVVPMIIYR